MKANENNQNAYIGSNVEKLFINSIGDHPSSIKKITEYFNIKGRYLKTISSGKHAEKADAKMEFACGRNIDVNIKSYKPPGFNQLTRSSVENFCTKFNLSEDDKKELENIIINKAKQPKDDLFPKDSRDKWRCFFESNINEILKWCFSNKPSREIFVLFNREENIMRIYPMKKVLNKISTEIVFTKGGINIGKSVSFQRKGGNGSLSKKREKYDIKHPGNDVQFKLRINKFIVEANSILLTEYTI